MDNDFEYLCRACAAYTKKKASVAECVYILKTPNLKEKLEKYLHLKVSESDLLPKVLCRACFRQVESTASLSLIAENMQAVLSDYLISDMAKSQRSLLSQKRSPPIKEPIAQTSAKANAIAPNVETTAIIIQDDIPIPTNIPTGTGGIAEKDEVVVNVSVSDPLTRETQQKMISSAAQRRKTSADSRFTPKSIAQRAFTSTPKYAESLLANKKPSPPGIINFLNGQPQQVTTLSSGGYVIASHTPPTETVQKDTTPLNGIPRANIAKNIERGVALNAEKGLQRKRKFVNCSGTSSGLAQTKQVSLLKALQPRPPLSVKDTVLPSALKLCQNEDEELPVQMIIAAAKKKKEKQQQQRAKRAAVAAAVGTHSKKKNKRKEKEKEKPVVDSKRIVNTNASNSVNSVLSTHIHLGSVIRDPDLLKLILKALQWPVTKLTLELQMSRLRNSSFTEIMSDPNLLQDADLTQILGPYLAPVLALSMQQQQLAAFQKQAAPNENKTDKQTAEQLAKTIPYKLPAETSVQLVPASPECEITNAPLNATAAVALTIKPDLTKQEPPKKKSRASQKKHYVPKDGLQKPTSNIYVDLDRSFFSQLAMCTGSGENSTDVIRTFLQRQRSGNSRHKHVHETIGKITEDADIITVPARDLDDIVLIEGQNVLDAKTSLNKSSNNSIEKQSSKTVNFSLPSPPSAEEVVSPTLNKRSKTDIASTTAPIFESTTDMYPSSTTTLPQTQISESKTKDMLKEAQSSDYNKLSKESLSNSIPTSSSVCSLLKNKQETSPPAKTNARKLHTSKSALGQQLLEAIGLQKISSSATFDGSKTLLDTSAARGSVKKIRSMLKISLKQAQEQQQLEQRKHEEPIKQDADSTTKSIVKEVLIEAKDASTTEICDVEDHIDKVKLMVEEPTASEQKKPEARKQVQVLPVNDPNSRSLLKIRDNAKEKLVEKEINNIEEKEANAKKDIAASATTIDGSGKLTQEETVVKIPKKRGRKSKKEKQLAEELAAAARENEIQKFDISAEQADNDDQDSDAPSVDIDIYHPSAHHNRRPSRVSKTLSKYYKGPNKKPLSASLRRGGLRTVNSKPNQK